MKLLLAILTFIVLIVVIVRRYKKKRQILKNERKLELAKAMEVANLERKKLFLFLEQNENNEFYNNETIQKIDECRDLLNKIIVYSNQLNEKYSDEKISDAIDRKTEETKDRPKPLFDPVGLGLISGREVGKAMISVQVLLAQVNLFSAYNRIQKVFFEYSFGFILKDKKEDKELIKKCSSFLEEELKVFNTADQFKLNDQIGVERTYLINSIFGNLSVKEISQIYSRFPKYWKKVA